MLVRILVLIAVVCGLTACSSNPPQSATTGVATEGKRITGVKLTPGVIEIAKKEGKVELTTDDRVRCEKYTTTGSHRVKFRCVTHEEDIASREANTREMRKLQTPPPSEGARTIGQ